MKRFLELVLQAAEGIATATVICIGLGIIFTVLIVALT